MLMRIYGLLYVPSVYLAGTECDDLSNVLVVHELFTCIIFICENLKIIVSLFISIYHDLLKHMLNLKIDLLFKFSIQI